MPKASNTIGLIREPENVWVTFCLELVPNPQPRVGSIFVFLVQLENEVKSGSVLMLL